MSIKPIDLKTNLMANDAASRLRESQKAQESGLAENVKQNKDESDHKAESVQKTEASEEKVIRKEDEEEEKKGKKQPTTQIAKSKSDEEDQEKPKHPQIPDGLRGSKIDLKI